MLLGMRVLRGPDWDQNEADGGEGHLGTVVRVKADEGTAEVVWDNGQVTACRVGKEGKYDLRILDNAQAGIRHTGITCNGCRKSTLFGIRWRCVTCSNFDLCTVCYLTNVHDPAHPFDRVTTENDARVRVEPRRSSSKVRLVGIFPGAKVTRGRHWESGDVDGGAGGVGTVVEVVSPESGSARNAVRVSWDSGQSLQHRLGLHGKVDLVCVSEIPGPFCYITHLPVFASKYARRGPTSRVMAEEIRVGDSVRVEADQDTFMDIQKQTCGWSAGMKEYIGRPGKVIAVTAKGDVDVQFERVKWRIRPDVLKKITHFAVGDTVRIISDAARATELQKDYGGWNETLAHSLGKVGIIRKIYPGGELKVQFGLPDWTFHPLCCTPAPGCPEDNIGIDTPEAIEIMQKTCEEAMRNEGKGFSERAVRDAQKSHVQLTHAALLHAIVEGNMDKTRTCLDKHPELITTTVKSVPLLHAAVSPDREDLLRLLLERGAEVNRADSDGDTPLLVAASHEYEGAVRSLLQAGADPDLCNFKCRTALHKAAVRHNAPLCRLLLDHNANPNLQDAPGDTALMDTLHKADDVDVVRALVTCPRLNLKVTNNRGFDAFHLCALKNRPRAMELILARDRSVVHNCHTEEKMTALHVAALNDHTEVIGILHRAGASLNAIAYKNRTPLHMAANGAHIESTRLLVQYGANVNAADINGNTILHVALDDHLDSMRLLMRQRPVEERERLQVANFLIQHGARLDLRNSDGKTPLQVPSDSLRRKMEDFLKDHQIFRADSSRDRKPTNETHGQKQEERKEIGPKCIQCSRTEACVIFLPCAHKIMCLGCGPSTSRCPSCGAEVKFKVDSQGEPVETSPQSARKNAL